MCRRGLVECVSGWRVWRGGWDYVSAVGEAPTDKGRWLSLGPPMGRGERGGANDGRADG